MIKPSQPGFRPWENRPASLRSRKCIPPLVAGATTFPPQAGAEQPVLIVVLLMKGLLFRALFFPLNRGKSGAARIGGGERSEPVSRIVFHAI